MTSPHPPETDLIYDWNNAGGSTWPSRGKVEIDDETLRDGLQSPSVKSPSLENKLRILHLMEKLGIDSADIGLPGAGPHVVATVTRLAREIVDSRMKIRPNCAARTIAADIVPIIEISQKVGIPIEVACFIGSSPIRQYAEDWDLDRLLRLSEEAVSLAVREGLPVMYVTELDPEVKVDWHGHQDRGFGVANALWALEAGAHRVHACALGIGERVGNTPMDQLLVNMQLLGGIDRDLTRLNDYCAAVSEATGVPIPDNYPIVGKDAFRTGTGVHAAAIIKARKKGDEWLADRVYSGVPASMVGRRQVIEIGPMSGLSNVHCWLENHGIEPRPALQ